MKQENKFVAQLFHYIAPFVDLQRQLFICVDGGAAKAHAGRPDSPLVDSNVPDLWLSLIGKEHAFGIEAKVLDGNHISVRQNQIVAWRTNGVGHYKPSFWVATNRNQTEYWCWSHSTIVHRLDGTMRKQADVPIRVDECTPEYQSTSLAGLALHLLTHAA